MESDTSSASNSHLENQIKNELNCPICLGEFDDPRFLPCLHTFCSSCLNALPKSKGNTYQIACPICRQTQSIPSDGFPKNFWVNNLQSIVSTSSSNPPLPKFKCCECPEEKDAFSRCVECGEHEYLCDFHVEAHKMSKRTVGHIIERLPQVQPNSPPNTQLNNKIPPQQKKQGTKKSKKQRSKERKKKKVSESDDSSEGTDSEDSEEESTSEEDRKKERHRKQKKQLKRKAKSKLKDSEEETTSEEDDRKKERKQKKHPSKIKAKTKSEEESAEEEEKAKKLRQQKSNERAQQYKSTTSESSPNKSLRDSTPLVLRHYDTTTKRRPKLDNLITSKWGAENSVRYQIVMRYWITTRTQDHWMDLYRNRSSKFIHNLNKGYMEPIPTSWVQSKYLAFEYPEGSFMANTWESKGEKRLYYILNNIKFADGSKPPRMRPTRNIQELIRRGNARNARAKPIPEDVLSKYQSDGDVFRNTRSVKSDVYSSQVGNPIYQARAAALNELAERIRSGKEHLETMILIDVSTSMTWDPQNGVTGPDGILRYHDQPSNISLVKNLVHRSLGHMIPRAQKEHPKQTGIDCVTFSNYGRHIGRLSFKDFEEDWRTKVNLGGGTQIMTGWQTVKNIYFTKIKSENHGYMDSIFGWQSTPGMPKLSLLVFLDGEANDMDEFELELLGESWAYVTIVLVGMEGCPHHHSHAIELERVSQFNPHVGFFDVHGRVCERMIIEDVLSSVYPVDPPDYDEILAFDL